MKNLENVQKYEIMAIITNSLDGKAAKSYADEAISQKIKSAGGTISFEDFWGERGFAYIIKKQKWGYYIVLQFEVDKSALTELRKDWNIDTKIIRFLITKLTPRSPEPRSYVDMKKEWAALEKENAIKEIEQSSAKKGTKAAAPKPAATEEPKKTPAKAEDKPVKKTDVLDKKLDKILEDSSLDL